MDHDSFSFLVTTDNHMGYKEDDYIRRKDSYRAFKEALQISRDKDVDFILLGGDLFHVNRPSASVEHKCIKIIRQHMNAKVNRATSFTRIQGNFSHFRKLNHANFEDENITVPYPIMTIHGNHDDPTGPNAQSVCEKLATCGLLNYFGAVAPSSQDIVIEPIVLQKGNIKIALYGLGFIPDYKLKIVFDKGEISFLEPPKDSYNVLIVHQNRVPFQKNKCIPDDLFPTFFHLIIRGHEHSTQSPEILPCSEVNGLVYQPGSTVATSISLMEAAPKKVGYFSVKIADPKGNRSSRYKVDYELMPLKCCRRMIFKDIAQKDITNYIKKSVSSKKITSVEFQRHSRDYVADCIRKLLEENSKQHVPEGCHKMSNFCLPILRVRLEYCSKNERFDELDLSSQFYPNLVANKDIVLYKKQKLKEIGQTGETENVTFTIEDEEDDEDNFECVDLDEQKRDTIDVMIENYFKEKPGNFRLQALSLNEYTNAVKGASEDGNVISKVISKKKQEIIEKYRKVIEADGQSAALDYHDESTVEKWFIKAFGAAVNINNICGDGDIVMLD